MDGLINIYKEKGFTSHDVVAKMRGILHMKKIGHTGTLDPDATGVLPVCIGKGTRLCSLLENHDKTYEAVLLLGLETDTQDISGKIVDKKNVSVTEEQVLAVLDGFRGKIMQIPPMYSALKVNGKKLYEYAREGKVIERSPRPVEIYELKVKNMDLPRVTLTVTCSKGTYIRTLCHDIGRALGCGGCMESLVRTRVGSFYLKDSITLQELEEKRDRNLLESCIVSVEELFADFPGVHTAEMYDILVRNGNRIGNNMLKEKTVENQVRMYDSSGLFVGIYEYDPGRKDYKPLKMFL
ncbi:MAG: tRNA pseudouridine(55) synthase TruB [Lachnospiraceae bacterium]|nr:tRNA pseudouridine(55) synthase TruB [Lachnospiraceae bacterium]